MSQEKWNYQTRVLHFGMALAVTFQLFISLIMEAPDEKDAGTIARLAMEAHELVGMTALLIVIAHWWGVQTKRVDGGLTRLFPFSGQAWIEVKEDLHRLSHKQLPEGGPRDGLPGLVHGLGFVAVTGMVVTGGILFLLFPEQGEPGKLVEIVAEVHESISVLVWIYWLSHVALAIMHHRAGHGTLQDMFNLKRD